MTSIDNILTRLERVKKNGKGWQALCPAHEDRRASLSLTEGKDGKLLLYCHAGCSLEAVVTAAGLKMSDLFPDKSRKVAIRVAPRIVETYEYTDTAGKLLYEVVRYAPKDFRQRVPNGNGGWNWSMKGVTRVLFQLPLIKQAVKDGHTIFICEGEKDCLNLLKISVPATTNAGGAKAAWTVTYSKALSGANGVILADNDDPGREHGKKVAQALQGYAASVKVLMLPELPPKGDVSDWIDAGGTKAELLELASACPEWEPKAEPTKAEDDEPEPPSSDLSNAEYFVRRHGRNVKFNVDEVQYRLWDNKRWQRDHKAKVKLLTAEAVKSMYELLPGIEDYDKRKELFKHIHASENRSRLEAMESLAQSREGIPIRESELDVDPMLLTCLNGTLELRTGELRPHRREDLISKLAPVEYDSHAECPRWLQFLDEVFQGNRELIGFVRRSIGCWLTGDCRDESLWILYGKGQTGKSKFTEVLHRMLGDYAATAAMSTFTQNQERNTYDLATLAGARFVEASEASDQDSFDEALLKQITGRDRIKCRPIYGRPFEYQPQFKPVIRTNELPRIKSQGYDMKRRLKVIPFKQRFYDPDEGKTPVQDVLIMNKLLPELSGILSWAVAGCLQWQECGLMVPTCVKSEINSVFEQQDPLAEFLDQCCCLEVRTMVRTADLWRAYTSWCEFEGQQPLFRNLQVLSRNLTKRDGIEAIRDCTGARALQGIGLLTQLTHSDTSCEPPHERDLHGEVCRNTPDASIASKRQVFERENEPDDVPEDYEPGSEG